MSETTAQLLTAILALPAEERAVIRDALDESLRDAELDSALAKPMEDIRSGRVTAVPGDDFFIRLRSQG